MRSSTDSTVRWLSYRTSDILCCVNCELCQPRSRALAPSSPQTAPLKPAAIDVPMPPRMCQLGMNNH